jgi:hypothetical protein
MPHKKHLLSAISHAPALGFLGLIFVLTGCGGLSDDSKNSSATGATGGTAGSGDGGSSATGGSTAVLAVDRTCNVPSDCVVQSLSCCPSCGVPIPNDYTAINYSSQYDFQRRICKSGATCAACDAQVGVNVLVATCEHAQCVLIDLLDNAVSACSIASECYVRAPECCECGGSTDAFSVIALSSTSSIAYSALVCSPTQACADCVPVYPADSVDCISGHCRVVE